MSINGPDPVEDRLAGSFQDVMAVQSGVAVPEQASSSRDLVNVDDALEALVLAGTVLDRIAQNVAVTGPQLVQGIAYLAVAYEHLRPLPRATADASAALDRDIEQAVTTLRLSRAAMTVDSVDAPQVP